MKFLGSDNNYMRLIISKGLLVNKKSGLSVLQYKCVLETVIPRDYRDYLSFTKLKGKTFIVISLNIRP